MKIEIVKTGVTDHSSLLDVGTVIEIDDKNGASLIAGGYAVAVEVEDDEEDEGGKTPTFEEMAKALDKKFNAENLKAAATAVGVAFPADAKKSDVVAAVINAGKYADLMA